MRVRVRRSQPTRPVRHDPNNYFGARCIGLVVPIGGELLEAGPFGNGKPFTKTGTVLGVTYKGETGVIDAAARGAQAVTFDTASDVFQFDYGRVIAPATEPELSIFGSVYSDTGGTADRSPVSWGNGASSVARLNLGDGANSLRYVRFTHVAAGASYYRAGAWTVGQLEMLSGSKVRGTATPPALIANGAVTTGGGTSNSTGDFVAGINSVRVGLRHGGSVNGDGGLVLAALFNKAFTDDEHVELHRNPWQLFLPHRAVVYSFPSVGALPTISGTSDSNTLIDEAEFVVSGANLGAATAVTVRQTDRPAFDATAYTTANTSGAVTLTGLDVQDMSMAYGAATVEVTTAAGTSSAFAITIAPKPTQQFITLSGHTPGAGWALGNATDNGDQLVAPLLTAQGATFVFDGTDGSHHITGGPEYTGAGDTAYWAWFDASADQWYETPELSLGSGGDEYPLLRHAQMRQARAGRVVAFSRRGGARR